jgi:hypothetical protein
LVRTRQRLVLMRRQDCCESDKNARQRFSVVPNLRNTTAMNLGCYIRLLKRAQRVIEAVRQFADMREAGIDFDQSGTADDRGIARRGETKDAPSEAFDAPEIENGMLVDAAAEASNAKRPRRSMFAPGSGEPA